MNLEDTSNTTTIVFLILILLSIIAYLGFVIVTCLKLRLKRKKIIGTLKDNDNIAKLLERRDEVMQEIRSTFWSYNFISEKDRINDSTIIEFFREAILKKGK